ncbi:MAG TPA: hypothetical protein VGP73_18445 [Thermoanaerobaculia bacterium]
MKTRIPKTRPFTASVTYLNADGRTAEETFPVRSSEYTAASRLAVAYILQVLKLREFEMRIVGA